MEKLYELQQEQLLDLSTGDITQEEFNKLQEKMNDKLAHLQLVSKSTFFILKNTVLHRKTIFF